jgi:hypothetical protein
VCAGHLWGKARRRASAVQENLYLTVEDYFRVVEDPGHPHPWATRWVGYQYTLRDIDDREIVAYHWYPEGRSHITTPHIHLGPGAEIGRRDLARAHLRAGRVMLEDMLQFVITELGVRPLRRDWSEVLDRTRRAREQAEG